MVPIYVCWLAFFKVPAFGGGPHFVNGTGFHYALHLWITPFIMD
jgi:hypothetical protein